MAFGEFYAFIHGMDERRSPSSIRISLGLATNFADVYRFLHFAYGFLD